MKKSGLRMMQEARYACQAVAQGPFTPVVFDAYEHMDGEYGYLLGHPSETVSGQSCIIWDTKIKGKKAPRRG